MENEISCLGLFDELCCFNFVFATIYLTMLHFVRDFIKLTRHVLSEWWDNCWDNWRPMGRGGYKNENWNGNFKVGGSSKNTLGSTSSDS